MFRFHFELIINSKICVILLKFNNFSESDIYIATELISITVTYTAFQNCSDKYRYLRFMLNIFRSNIIDILMK